MGKVYENINERTRSWIERQKMFFVASAPLSGDGLINLSPKGLDSLRVLDSHTLAYLDIGGSGVETIAHVRENGRIVIMLCAFDGPPQIMRFHGAGEVVTPADSGFDELAGLFGVRGVGIRAVIKVHCERISDSCGYGVPNYTFDGHRQSSQNHYAKTGVDGMRAYQLDKSLHSLDGIPALDEDEANAFIDVSSVIGDAGK
ncbi:MAG: pyridoxamine 5'-phosphate oxidase family protein [Gammaproteobacteria bacterium]|nr:pyridoxamine 5'-phosphate oxidase family protein [Gammaproteobacteria bacterium]